MFDWFDYLNALCDISRIRHRAKPEGRATCAAESVARLEPFGFGFET